MHERHDLAPVGRSQRRELVLIRRHTPVSEGKRIPAAWAGILFFLCAARFAPASGGADELALALFGEGDWAACRVECVRVLAADATDETAALLKGAAGLRLGQDATGELRAFCARPAVTSNAAAMARFEMGRYFAWHDRAGDAAAELVQAFRGAQDPAVSLPAGCRLDALLAREPALAEAYPAVRVQLGSCRSLWTPDLRARCVPPTPRASESGWLGRPVGWMIALYRTQIRPAIGQRCSLVPSCSEYCLRAVRKHGLVAGLAAYGDRAVREPDVVSEKRRPVMVNGRRRYPDPLEEHDAWLGD
jgi:hypothetical protein